MNIMRNSKRILSGILGFTMATTLIPFIPAAAEEAERYPYTMFAASNADGAITINANNFCANGSIATNGTIVSSGNVNVNGNKTENANEDMIYIQKKLNYSYFSGSNVELYADDYTLEDLNININNPMDVTGTLELTGNINLNSGIKALEDVNLNGEVKNANNSVIFSETGDININTVNTNFSGLIYAPYGDIVIDTDNLNLNNVVIIGQTITLDCPNINANYSTYMAELVGTESDIDVELYAMGEYNSEANSIDIEWFSNYENCSYEIWTSDDNTSYTSIAVVTDSMEYQYAINEDFDTKYFKVSLTTNYGEYIESIPFIVTKDEDGYTVDFLDSDGDGLPDVFEVMLGTDIDNIDSDDDGLTDYQEVYITGTNPTKYDSVTEGISDSDADSDEDGLSNIYEIEIGTDPQDIDTDSDGLSDYDELYVYGTFPLNIDTDGDGLEDGDEIALGLNPLVADSDNNGIPDNQEKIYQTLCYNDESNSTAIETVELSFTGNGYIKSNTAITPADHNTFVNNLVGLVGKPFSFESSSEFDEATISFKINMGAITSDDVTNLKDLGIVWFDEQFQQFRLLESIYDLENNIISVNVPHFSIYCVIDKNGWILNHDNFYFTTPMDLTDNDDDRMPDCFESTNRENPENKFLLSNKTETFSLLNKKHSDDDGICDGKEIVYCLIGDINEDWEINSDDVTLLQNYLNNSSNLSKTAIINSDVNIDGKITEDDLSLLEHYVTAGNTTGNELDPRIGDVNGDGIRNASDLILLQGYILGRYQTIYGYGADINGDNIIDSFDMALLRRLIIYNKADLVGMSCFYYYSDPMLTDTDGDLDPDNADPDPISYQLNGYFAQKMGELQKAAQTYLGSSYKITSSDEYYGMKDVWLSFYYIRSLKKSYTQNKWKKVAGNEEEFLNYINTNNQYSELKGYFSNLQNIYANENGDVVEVRHLAAVVSSLAYYPTIGELLPDNISFFEALAACLLLDRNEVNQDLDILSSWGGDLQQLMNSAYESTSEGTISDKVYTLLGEKNTGFDMEDLYSDIDAEVIYSNIRKMYAGRKKYGTEMITTAINNCYSIPEKDRYILFCNSVKLSVENVEYAEKKDLATEYGLNKTTYQIFKYPEKLTKNDYHNIAVQFINKLNVIFGVTQ